jgi:hypothetical protein
VTSVEQLDSCWFSMKKTDFCYSCVLSPLLSSVWFGSVGCWFGFLWSLLIFIFGFTIGESGRPSARFFCWIQFFFIILLRSAQPASALVWFCCLVRSVSRSLGGWLVPCSPVSIFPAPGVRWARAHGDSWFSAPPILSLPRSRLAGRFLLLT